MTLLNKKPATSERTVLSSAIRGTWSKDLLKMWHALHHCAVKQLGLLTWSRKKSLVLVVESFAPNDSIIGSEKSRLKPILTKSDFSAKECFATKPRIRKKLLNRLIPMIKPDYLSFCKNLFLLSLQIGKKRPNSRPNGFSSWPESLECSRVTLELKESR